MSECTIKVQRSCENGQWVMLAIGSCVNGEYCIVDRIYNWAGWKDELVSTRQILDNFKKVYPDLNYLYDDLRVGLDELRTTDLYNVLRLMREFDVKSSEKTQQWIIDPSESDFDDITQYEDNLMDVKERQSQYFYEACINASRIPLDSHTTPIKEADSLIVNHVPNRHTIKIERLCESSCWKMLALGYFVNDICINVWNLFNQNASQNELKTAKKLLDKFEQDFSPKHSFYNKVRKGFLEMRRFERDDAEKQSIEFDLKEAQCSDLNQVEDQRVQIERLCENGSWKMLSISYFVKHVCRKKELVKNDEVQKNEFQKAKQLLNWFEDELPHLRFLYNAVRKCLHELRKPDNCNMDRKNLETKVKNSISCNISRLLKGVHVKRIEESKLRYLKIVIEIN